MIEQIRYRPGEFDAATWAVNGEKLCTFNDGKIQNRSSCFDQKSKNCDNAVIPLKKGKFEYVTAVHTSMNGIAGDVFIFNQGYIRGDNAQPQCGDSILETTTPIVLTIILGIICVIFIALFVLKKCGKSVICCNQNLRQDQQNMTRLNYDISGTEISGTLNAPLMNGTHTQENPPV